MNLLDECLPPFTPLYDSDHVFLQVPLRSSLIVVHPVFHVSKLRPYISRDDNCVDGLVALENRTSQSDVPVQDLDKRDRKLWNRFILEYLEAWTNHPLIYATQELEALIRKHFPSLITEGTPLSFYSVLYDHGIRGLRHIRWIRV
ncbi:hypothetical protein KP509_13G067900 [Ceratopteris richardii]|uniref:Uncharacterized protein n=1 Tax=Ceratopteris richardii TaxID=49495 RepID=A0A8T2TIH0_CERRI|nr:hypothetical protein KP509_13G067900 [Ceratopteris richardii]